MCTFNSSDQLFECRETFRSYLLTSCEVTAYNYWDADSYVGPLRDAYYHKADPQVVFRSMVHLIPYPGLVREILNDRLGDLRVSDYLKSFWPLEVVLFVCVIFPLCWFLVWAPWRLGRKIWRWIQHSRLTKGKIGTEATSASSAFAVTSRFRGTYQTNYERFHNDEASGVEEEEFAEINDGGGNDEKDDGSELQRRIKDEDDRGAKYALRGIPFHDEGGDLKSRGSVQVSRSRNRHYLLRVSGFLIMIILIALMIKCFEHSTAPELTAINCAIDRTLFETFYGSFPSAFDSAFSQHTDFRGLAKIQPLLGDLFTAVDDLRRDLILSDVYKAMLVSFKSNFAAAYFTGHYLKDSKFSIRDVSHNEPQQIVTLNHGLMLHKILNQKSIFNFESTYAAQLLALSTLNNIPSADAIKDQLIRATTLGTTLIDSIAQNLAKALTELSAVIHQIYNVKQLVFDEKLRVICLLITALLPCVLAAVTINALYLHRGNPVKHRSRRIRKFCMLSIGALSVLVLLCAILTMAVMAFLSHGCQVLGYDLLQHDKWSKFEVIHSLVPAGIIRHCLTGHSDGDLLSGLGAKEYIDLAEGVIQEVASYWQQFSEVGLLVWLTAQDPVVNETLISKLQEDHWLTLILSTSFQSHPNMYLTDERVIWVTDLVPVATPFDFYGTDTLSYIMLTELLHQATQAIVDTTNFPSFAAPSRQLPWVTTFKRTLHPLSALTTCLRDLVKPTCPSFADALCAEPDTACQGTIWIGPSSMPVIDDYEKILESELTVKMKWSSLARNIGLYSKDIQELLLCMGAADMQTRVSFLNALHWIYLKTLIYSGSPLERSIQSYTEEDGPVHDPCYIGHKCHLFALIDHHDDTEVFVEHSTKPIVVNRGTQYRSDAAIRSDTTEPSESATKEAKAANVTAKTTSNFPLTNPLVQVPLSVYRKKVTDNIVRALRKDNHQLARHSLDSILWLNSATRLWKTLISTPAIFNCSIAREFLERSSGSICMGTASQLTELALLWTVFGFTGLVIMLVMLLLIYTGRYKPKAYIANIGL